MPYEEICLKESTPVGTLGIIPLESCKELGAKVNNYLVNWRQDRDAEHYDHITLAGYKSDSYIVKAAVPRFGSGEAKGSILQSVRGLDIFLIVDVTNYSLTYSLCGQTNHMSPDDHYSDLKRIIAAIEGKAKRITVIMPFLYESRQHKRSSRESLDCAIALQELISMGVDNIITFDAHDPRVQNAIPLLMMRPIEFSLEQIFLKIIRDSAQGAEKKRKIKKVIRVPVAGSAAPETESAAGPAADSGTEVQE